MEFKEFKPWFKSAKSRFKISAGLNLETFDTIFKWNQPYLNRGFNLNHRSNSLNSATDLSNKFLNLVIKTLILVMVIMEGYLQKNLPLTTRPSTVSISHYEY